ncbi:hypothetical protein RKD42_002985 [Streptomyces ambofaciens]
MGAVAGRAGQPAQEQLAHAGAEGVGAGRPGDRGEQSAEDDLGQVLGPRVRLHRGLHQPHHRQVGAAEREVAGQPVGLRGGAGAEAQDEFLGGQPRQVGAVVGVGGQRAVQRGGGARIRGAARTRHQRRPVGQPLGPRLQHGYVGRARGRPGRGAVVRREGERGAGRGPMRGGQPARDRRQGGVPPQLLGQRLEHGQRCAARPAAQRVEPAGARRALAPLRSRAVADQQHDRTAVGGDLGPVPADRAVGLRAVQGDGAEDARLGERGVQFADEGLPDGHRGARVVHQVQAQPPLPYGAQHGQPPLGPGAEARDAVGGRGLVHLVTDGRVAAALQWTQGTLQRQRVAQHRRCGREQGAVRLRRRGARGRGRGRQAQGGAAVVGRGRGCGRPVGPGAPSVPVPPPAPVLVRTPVRSVVPVLLRGVRTGRGRLLRPRPGRRTARRVRRVRCRGLHLPGQPQEFGQLQRGRAGPRGRRPAEGLGEAGQGRRVRCAGAVGGHQKASGRADRPRYGISRSASSSRESAPRPEERAR